MVNSLPKAVTTASIAGVYVEHDRCVRVNKLSARRQSTDLFRAPITDVAKGREKRSSQGKGKAAKYL